MSMIRIEKIFSEKLLIATIAGSIFGLHSPQIATAASFTGLGFLGDNNFRSYSEAEAISADGSTVVGSGNFARDIEAFIWNSSDGIESIETLAEESSLFLSFAYGISADGSVVVGSKNSDSSVEAFIWDGNNGMKGLGYLNPNRPTYSEAKDLSANGSVVVGTSFNGTTDEAFIWDSKNGMRGLGFLKGSGLFPASKAEGISADGSVVVGNSTDGKTTEAFIWDSINGMQGLGYLSPNLGKSAYSKAFDISADGSIVVGGSVNGSSTNNTEAFIWSKTQGMQGLGFLSTDNESYDNSNAYSVSADGSVVVGSAFKSLTDEGTKSEAFIWDGIDGMRSIKEVLSKDYRLNLTGWELSSARAVSADGLAIVGVGINPNGQQEAWIARLDDLTKPQTVPEPASLYGLLALGTLGIIAQNKQEQH